MRSLCDGRGHEGLFLIRLCMTTAWAIAQRTFPSVIATKPKQVALGYPIKKQ